MRGRDAAGHMNRAHTHPPNAPPRRSLGIATQELVILLVAAVSIGGVAAFVGPRLVRAESGPAEPVATLDNVSLGLKGLVESAAEVIAVETEPLTQDTFVVLWGGDPSDPGEINRGEIVVLHFSNARRVLSAWVCAEPRNLFNGIGEKPPDTRTFRVPRWRCEKPDFGSEWAQTSDVERRVIGTGVRSFRFERASGPNPHALFRIALTRAASETDGELKESVFDARLGVALATATGSTHTRE